MIESLEQEIIKRYVPGETSLREVAKALNTNHKLVRRALDNLQFLTWFENRCKNNMSQSEWDDIKTNIGLYLI